MFQFSISAYYHFNSVFVVIHRARLYIYCTPQHRLDTARVALHTLNFTIHQTPTFPIVFPSIAHALVSSNKEPRRKHHILLSKHALALTPHLSQHTLRAVLVLALCECNHAILVQWWVADGLEAIGTAWLLCHISSWSGLALLCTR
jgi:hypothetical protein